MTSRARILAVLAGRRPDRVPVCLPGIDPHHAESFYTQHRSFSRLLDTCRALQDTLRYYRPHTGFFFSAPESVELNVEEQRDTPLSRVTKLTVETPKGTLSRSARKTIMSTVEWVTKPWFDSHVDIEKFLALPYRPHTPDLSDFAAAGDALGEKGVMVVRLPTPLGVVGGLFAPGQMPQYIMEYPGLFHRLLEELHRRLVDTYRAVSRHVKDTVIRMRGAEYVTPPILPTEYFHDARRVFSEFAVRYDKPLVDILRQGEPNHVCYHWHDFTEELAPLVLKINPDIVEPVCNSVENQLVVKQARKALGDKVIVAGIETEDLQFRSPKDIRALAKETIRQGGRNGRFILAPDGAPCSAPLDANEERNYIGLLEAAHEDGVYPLK